MHPRCKIKSVQRVVVLQIELHKNRPFISKQTDSFKYPNFVLPRVFSFQRISQEGQKHPEPLQREKSLCTQRAELVICMLEAEPGTARQGSCFSQSQLFSTSSTTTGHEQQQSKGEPTQAWNPFTVISCL